MCVDFRKINELQPKTRRVDKQTDTQGNLSLIPLPKIDEMYANLRGAKVFTTLDLRSGYYHIALDQESKAKTAFVTPFGKYEFNAVPFGLAQAPAYFQQLISIVLQDCSDFAMAYLDDIIIFSQNEEDHLKHIEIIFKKLKKADLKLKESKCDFFKREIHYLGHLISVDGIQPLPEKLESIHNMPKPRSPKEIKQFLGLTGYYRKFVPRFSDMARPLTKLLAHDCEFKWTNQCDISFQMLKDTLCSAPILKYPDTSKPYTLYTDASKYGWAGVLTQSHTSSIGGKEITMDHPVSYISGLFRGSQLNWAALTKEAYAIYMSVKKSTFYLTGHEITLRSDHLPLRKFLRKMTLNNTVNNWSTEIESFNINFVHISGKANVLADTLSRLIDTDPDLQQQPELEGHEFGKYCFETLPKARGSVSEVKLGGETAEVCEIQITYDNPENSEFSVELPLEDSTFASLQGNDPKIRDLRQKVEEGENTQFYFVKNNVLFRSIVDNGHKFEVRVIPESLQDVVLHLGHNQSGHNGYQRTYAAIKRLYYWKGMRTHVLRYCKSCKTCAVQKVQKTQFEKQIFEPGVQPMEFVSMDLIGEFHPPSSRGNRYALTAVCMLTGYTFCIPIKSKTAEEIATAWRNHIAFPFGVCRKLLTDNGTEFKNDLFSRVAEQLGVERKIYSPPYRPQSNGRIEGFHKFLKSCLAKHISRHREWDEVVPLATASYNWLPNQHSKESPFFVMFGRDAVTNLSQLTKPKLRYMGTEDLILDLELMSSIFQTQIHNLRMARERVIEGQQPVKKPNIEVGDLVLVRDHTSKCFMPKYKVDFRVVHVQGNRAEVKDNNGKLTWYHISDIKKTDMVTKLICQLPDVDAFGRTGRLSFDPERVKDLGWVPNDWNHRFNPDHVKEAKGTVKNTPKERSHQMELRSRDK